MEMFKGGISTVIFLVVLIRSLVAIMVLGTEDVLVPQGLVAGFNPYGLMLVLCFCACIPKGIYDKKEKGN